MTYDKRLDALRALLKSKKLPVAAVARHAGLTTPGEYGWAGKVVRGDERGEPTLAKLEAAAAKL